MHETILSNRFLIVRAKKLRCGREESRRFYREHAGRRAGAGAAGGQAWPADRAGAGGAEPCDSGRLSPAGRFFYQRLVEFMARYLLCPQPGCAGRGEGAVFALQVDPCLD